MSENSKKLTPRQYKAIAELLKGSNIEQVSCHVGVSPRTLNRWGKGSAFQRELRQAELQVLDAVGLRLVSLAGDAVGALEDVLNNPSVRGASVKRLCAKDILDMVLKWRETLTFDERLTRLEERVLYGKK